MRSAAAALVAVLLLATACAAADSAPWPYLPNDDIGAYAFKKAHPTWDGRGVVVAVFDTGVDAFAPGLTETSTGEPKLIEARDFSTEGDWDLAEAEQDTTVAAGTLVYRHPDGLRLAGAEGLAVPPQAGDRVYVGVIPESRFQNSRGVTDLNDNGSTTDRFGVLVWSADRAAVEAKLGVGRGLERLAALNETARRAVAREREGTRVWLIAVDTDGNGSLAGESVLRDYRVNRDSFRLTAPDAPKARTLMSWEANVIPRDDEPGAARPPRLELHFDDGAHGSHCAGIATGFRVSGQQGLDGVAPGAWLMSCKIGDNTLSGGASRTESMRKAFAYAADFGKRYGLPVVVNMSYGILSVEENDAAIEKWLQEELPKHPELYVCTSCGNEGPGLSTAGLPATAFSVIASGAYLSPAAAASLYNARLGGPELFGFSSRGGETPKPDVVAPGTALSTVPGWVDGAARMNGTSMASPTTAGAVACLVGAARQERLPTHWGMVKRAILAGAVPVPGLQLPDHGAGLVNLGRSWDVLRRLAASRSARQVLWYRTETECAFQADGLAPAAYWRTPGGAPVAPRTVSFSVRPVFHPDLTPDQKDTFFRSFAFRSDADWIRLVTPRAYIRGDMAMTVDVQYDGAKLARPGLHTGRVLAALDGGDLSGEAGVEFSLWNTVITPEPLGAEQGFTRTFEGHGLDPSAVQRRFVAVPAGATALRVRLEVSDRVGARKGARAAFEIDDPDGHTKGPFVPVASVEGTPVQDAVILPPDLVPGIWEIDAFAPITAMDAADYRLTVSCDGYHAQPATIVALPRAATGKPAKASLEVTRAFPGVFRGAAQAAVRGFRREDAVAVTDSDIWTREFTLDAATPAAEFRLTLDKATANLFTDCSVNIVDADGKRIVSDSFNALEAQVSTRLPAGAAKGTYKLEVVGGFALAAHKAKWGFRLEERYLLPSPVAGAVRRGDAAELALYSGIPASLSVTFDAAWPQPPVGLAAYGEVRFLDRNLADKAPGDRDGQLVLEVPIRLE